MMWFKFYYVIVGDFMIFIYSALKQELRLIRLFWLDLIAELHTFPTTLWKPGMFFFEQDLYANLLTILQWISQTSKVLHLISLFCLTMYWLILLLLTVLFSWF